MLLNVVAVQPQADFSLLLEFENGERRRFDMTPYLERKPFVRIQALPLFLRARVEYGTVVWPGDIDIAPETLYDRSIPVPEDFAPAPDVAFARSKTLRPLTPGIRDTDPIAFIKEVFP